MTRRQPSKAFQARYTDAKQLRQDVKEVIEESLAFIMPGREQEFETRGDPQASEDDVDETFLSLPEELATDFASDLVTYYCPSESIWAEYAVSQDLVDEFGKDAVLPLVESREDKLQEMIQASNFNDRAPQIMFEANHGTVAMWVQQSHFAQPFYVENVPPHELLILPGHMGYLDRFREKRVRATQLKATFKGFDDVDLSDQRIQNKMQKHEQYCQVVWGFWIDWEDAGNPKWKAQFTVDDIPVTDEFELGPLAGACPLLVGRFNPQKAWGRGPAIKALPDMRVLNRLDEVVLDGLDQSLSPSLIYADDGFLDLEVGMEPGRAYPASRGFTREQIYEMQRGVNLDMGQISTEMREERLRSCFYQDGPRQTGDTPPTATQWLDQRRRVQQRIGKPSAPLWTEFFLPFIQRIEYIGVETGQLDAEITVDEKVISVQPVSPLQKAQNQDDIMVTRSNLQLGFEVMGEALPEAIDLTATMDNILEASGDRLTVVRSANAGTTTPPGGAGPDPAVS